MAMIHIHVCALVIMAFEHMAVTGQDVTCDALVQRNGFRTRDASAWDQCEDLTNWKDSTGKDCEKIVSQGKCGDDDDYGYDDDGTLYPDSGADAKAGAKQACCGCGGGMRTDLGKMEKCIDYADSKKRDWNGIGKNGHCFEKTSRGKRFKKHVPKGKMMFYGDSDIEYWKTEQIFPDANNCGVGGSTAYEAGKFAAKTAAIFQPKGHVVIVAGENDMTSAVECADTIFQTLKTAVDAFVNSKYHPTVIMFSTKPEPGTTKLHALYERYDALCKQLAEYAEMKGHFKFVHAYQKFLDLDAYQKNPGSFYQNDDLHMNNKGYDQWNTWLQETVKEGCHDLLNGAEAWKDKDGDTCATISNEGWCDFYADFTVDGVGANTACCECGGGCDDIAGWKDKNGDDCSTVVSGGNCGHADEYKVNDMGAKQACCGCGGGVPRQPLLA